MCEKLKYCNRNIDSCLIKEIEILNQSGFKTILSCCGHGKYDATVLVRDELNLVYELYTETYLRAYDPKKRKQYNRYYRKDKEGFYYIPELVNLIIQNGSDEN
ncbi:hypothetical protein LCGC14_2877150 [marine sediment metagenome]|uniref:Uncharacterized protein n=1 Tax=marine sediment metagenome TaxID=412755 RepID=A0A0F8Y167_9ZZZZ